MTGLGVLHCVICSLVFIRTQLEIECVYTIYVRTALKSLQSCPTLCDPIDGSPSGVLITDLEVGERQAEWEAQTSSQSKQTQELLGVTGNAQGPPEALGHSQGLGGPFPLLASR